MGAIAARAEALLQGNPLRFIVYGAAIVVWIVVGIVNALRPGYFPVVSLSDALPLATAAAVALTEACRMFVYSPATVNAMFSAAKIPSSATVTAYPPSPSAPGQLL